MNSVLEKESSVLERSDIKDISLAEQDKNNIEWALKDMPVLRKIEERFIKEQPFKGLKLSACVWRPSVTYKGNLFDISVAANVGYCKEYSFSAKKKAITIGIITFSINVKNDD